MQESTESQLPIPRIGNFWRSSLHQQFLYGNSIQEHKSRRERDNFNFFHSQLQINIECAFGQLVHQWPILHCPLSANFGVKKQIALVHALCSLHNFSKNQQYNNVNSMMQWEDVHFPIPDGNGGMILPLVTTIGTQIVSYVVTWRDDILDANDHFDNVNKGMSGINRQRYNCIQTHLCGMVAEHNL